MDLGRPQGNLGGTSQKQLQVWGNMSYIDSPGLAGTASRVVILINLPSGESNTRSTTVCHDPCGFMKACLLPFPSCFILVEPLEEAASHYLPAFLRLVFHYFIILAN